MSSHKRTYHHFSNSIVPHTTLTGPIRKRKEKDRLTNKRNHQPTPHLTNILRNQPNRRPHLPRNTNRQLGIRIRLFIVPPTSHKVIIHIRTLHAVQDIQEKNSAADSLVFEAADTAAAATLFGLLVGPFDHFCIGDFALAKALGERGEGFGDVAAHELPDETEGECALAVSDVCALDADEGEAHLLAEFDGVVRVLDGLEAHKFAAGSGRFVDVAPVDAAWDDFVVGLEEDGAVAEVVEEGVDGRLDVEGVEPEGEDAGFALAFGVEVFHLELFFFGDRVEARVGVEKVGDEGEVEFRVAGYKGGGGKKFAAVESVGVLEDFFGSLEEVAGLEGRAAADVGC